MKKFVPFLLVLATLGILILLVRTDALPVRVRSLEDAAV